MTNQADGSVIIKVDLNLDDFNKTEKESEKLASNLTKNFSRAGTAVANGIKAAFDVTLKAIAATSAAVTAASALGINYNMEMENYLADFTVMLGSTEKAVDHVEKLKTMAAKTPFEMTDLAQADKILLAFGSDAEEVQGQLQMLGDISLGNSQKLGTIATAFGRIQSNGRASLEEINMMIDQGFNPLNIIAETTGETMQEVRDRVSKGAVSFEEIAAAMQVATSEGGQFYKGMEVASKTASGQISTLKDNVNALLGDMTKGLFDGLKNELLPRVTEAVEDIHEAFNTGGAGAAIDTAANILTEFIGEIAKKAPGAIKEFLKTILPKLKQAGRTMILSLVEAMLGEDISKQLESVFDAVDDAFGDLIKTIGRHSSEIMSTIKDFISLALDVADDVLPAVIGGVEWLIDNMNDLIPVLGAVVSGFVGFKTIQTLTGIISGVSSAFTGLVSILAANPLTATLTAVTAIVGTIAASYLTMGESAEEYKERVLDLTEAEKTEREEAEKRNSAYQEMVDNSQKVADEIETQATHEHNLWEELQKITDENGKIKEGYEDRARVITEELTRCLGVEIDIVDDQILKYEELSKTIDEIILKKKISAISSAYQDDAIKAESEKGKALQAYNDQLEIVNDLEEDRKKILEDPEYQRLLEKNILEPGGFNRQENLSFLQYEQDLKRLETLIGDEKKLLDNNLKTYKGYASTYESYWDLMAAAEEGNTERMQIAYAGLTSGMETATAANRDHLETQLTDASEHYEEVLKEFQSGNTAYTQEMVDFAAYQVFFAREQLDKHDEIQKRGIQGTKENTEAAMRAQKLAIENGAPGSEYAMAQVKTSVENAAEMDLKTPAETAGDDFSTTIDSQKDKAGGAMQNVAKQVKTEASFSLKKQGTSVAESFLDAIINTIRSKSGWLNQFMANALSSTRDYTYQNPTGPGSESVSYLRYTPVEIPQLAKGTVIPPNAPYLAVVGDQKHGTNIEAPLDTIKQAVAETLAEAGSSKDREIHTHVWIGGRQILEIVAEENDMNTIATGHNILAQM